MRRTFVGLGAVLSVLSAGCGGGNAKVAQLSGRVYALEAELRCDSP